MRFLSQNSNGFTLIELLVVMSIITVLSGALLVMAGDEAQKIVLRHDALTLAQYFREMEEMAMAAEAHPCNAGETNVIGVNFKKIGGVWNEFYTLFGDCNKPLNYRYDGSDDLMRHVYLDQKVKICDVSSPGGSNNISILFRLPEPVVYVNGISTDAEVVVTLCLKKDESKIKEIKLNTVGRIEIVQ